MLGNHTYAQTGSYATIAHAASVSPAATTALALTKPLPASLDPTPLDQLLATAGKADQPLWSAGHRSRAHKPAAIGDVDVLAGEM